MNKESILRRPALIDFKRPGAAGFHIGPKGVQNMLEIAHSSPEVMGVLKKVRPKLVKTSKDIIKTITATPEIFDRALTGGIVAITPGQKEYSFVLRHELAHSIRDSKDIWSTKQYNWNPAARLVEEFAANNGSLKRTDSIIGEKRIKIPKGIRYPAAAVLSGTQEVEKHPILYGATAMGAGALIHKNHKKEAGFVRSIKDNVNYAAYVTKHKANIVSPMLQMGLPLTQAIKHDLSKYSPAEFPEYRDWFEGPKGLRGTKDPGTYAKWRTAVDHHYAHNDHHWKKNGLTWKEVPIQTRMESVADWYSVGKTNRPKGTQFPDFREWYATRQGGLPIDRTTKREINIQLGLNKKGSAMTRADVIMEKIAISGDMAAKALEGRAQAIKGMTGTVRKSFLSTRDNIGRIFQERAEHAVGTPNQSEAIQNMLKYRKGALDATVKSLNPLSQARR